MQSNSFICIFLYICLSFKVWYRRMGKSIYVKTWFGIVVFHVSSSSFVHFLNFTFDGLDMDSTLSVGSFVASQLHLICFVRSMKIAVGSDYTSFTNSSFNFLVIISAWLLATIFVQSLNKARMMHGNIKIIPWTMLKSIV